MILNLNENETLCSVSETNFPGPKSRKKSLEHPEWFLTEFEFDRKDTK